MSTGLNVAKAGVFVVVEAPVGVSVEKAGLWLVVDSPNTNPPDWSGVIAHDGTQYIPYSWTFDMPTSCPTVAYSVVSGALPDGLSLSALAGNQAKISGVPLVLDTFTFTLRATNAYGTVDQAFTIEITNVPVAVSGGAWAWLA